MDSPPRATPNNAPAGCPMHQQRQTSLYGPEFAADPHRVYDELRAHGPAAPIELAPGVEATLVVQDEAALRVLQNPALFARDPRRWNALPRTSTARQPGAADDGLPAQLPVHGRHRAPAVAQGGHREPRPSPHEG